MRSKKDNDKAIQYLQMIQEPIARMSTTSAVIKGFAVTTALGAISISIENSAKCVLLLASVPVVAFAAMDIYYLSLERRYRYLYQQVLDGSRQADFSMKLENDPTTRYNSRSRFTDCVLSPCIFLFYLAIALFLFGSYVLL